MKDPSYDTIPYQSHAFKETHPLHLFTLGRLHGLNPTPIEKAKVLELGCASGGNIIPMAFYSPKTRFTGIDLAPTQIVEGKEIIKALGLNNIELYAQSIVDFKPRHKFDYIICHGVYSWVDNLTRHKILAICHDSLTDNGIAYISYNTYPGWMTGMMLREMMSWHTENIINPYDKLEQARYFLQFMHAAIKEDQTGYGELMNQELHLLAHHPNSHFIHEHLSSHNHPLFFYQFMNEAEKHQLTFLCEAFRDNEQIDHWPLQFNKELRQISSRVTLGQYQDIIENRRFRSTLLCHQNQKTINLDNKNEMTEYFTQWEQKTYEKTPVSSKPTAHFLARVQAQKGLLITNPRHENIQLTPVAAVILPYLDGSHDLQSLIQIVQTKLEEGEIMIVDANHQEIKDDKKKHQEIHHIIELTLILLAQKGLLSA